ncbi:MAG: aldehyde dehydrogenase family protein [Vicinamibacterales bacterium]
MQQHTNVIGGERVPSSGGAYYTIRNPARPGERLGEFPDSTRADAASAIEAAQAGARTWAATTGPQRGAALFRFSELLAASKSELARIVTLEQGKALGEAMGEVARAAAEARFMAGEASRPMGLTFPSERPGSSCYTVAEPLGIVATICPWNFPVVTPVRKIAPALAWGNSVVFKPASLTPWSAVYLMQLLDQAGVPPGVVNLVTGSGSVVGDALTHDTRVHGISFTGSTTIGTQVSEGAGRRLARVQLELGGKNPAVVVGCDDLDGAAREIVAAAFLCSGQRCTALSRVIVADAQADALIERLLFHVNRIKVGNGLDAGTTMGPLVSERQLRTVEQYVRQGVDSGCVTLTGGCALTENPTRDGYYHAPTVFDRVPADSSLALDEIFGPVLPILRVRDFEEAIAIANSTRYGLAASLFTSYVPYIDEFIRRVEAGMIHVNHGTASQAHIPFGGVKDSGQGAYSIGPTTREFFTNVKAIYIKW